MSVHYRKIGAGACGAIFCQTGTGSGRNSTAVALKLAKDRTNPELWNDFVQHRKIFGAFVFLFGPSPYSSRSGSGSGYGSDYDREAATICIPKPLGYITAAADDDHAQKFWEVEKGLRKAAEPIISALPTQVLVSERIRPLPKRTRELLIEKFCSPARNGREKALADPANADCLVRVYLGSISAKTGASGMFFSLRNLKLHLNQLVQLGLDVETLARRMGLCLAVMHWGARVDGRDVEFVLGSSSDERINPEVRREIEKEELQEEEEEEEHNVVPTVYRGVDDLVCRQTEMWVLDFNQVRDITLDDAGVALAVEAVKLNDPYFPKPLKESEEERGVWKAFVRGYMENSRAVLEEKLKDEEDKEKREEILELPRKFISGVTELERERMFKRERASV